MPSNNPKHVKKKVVYERKRTLKQRGVPVRFWIMGIIGVLVITAVILVVINIDDITNPDNGNSDPTLLNTVVDGCWISFNYKIFADLDKDGEIDYLGADAEVSAFINYHTTHVTRGNFFLGWYNGLIGLEKGESRYITIEAFVDEDNDGRNDDTGNLPMGYTPETSTTLAYQRLIIYVQILEIYAEDTFDIGTVTYTPNSGSISQISLSQAYVPQCLLPSQITAPLAYGTPIF